MSLSKDYYDVLDPYLPEEARTVLHNQRDIIEENIDKQIKGFATELQNDVESLVSEQVEVMQKDMKQALDKISQILDNTDADPAKLQAAASELKSAVEAQRQTIQSYGKNIRTAAITAARSAGLPVP